MNNIYFALSKYFGNFNSLLCHFPTSGQWNTQNIPWLYSVEQGRNMNRNDAYDLSFHFQFLNVNFSGVKAHQNFVLIFKKLKLLLFLLFSSFMHILCDG